MSAFKISDWKLPETLAEFGTELIKLKEANVYYLYGKDGAKVIKKLAIGAAQAKFIGELLSYLNSSGLAPELIRPKSGAAYFWIKGNRYFVTSFIPGRTADYFHLQDLQAVIRAMAVLHRITAGFLSAHPVCRFFLKFEPARAWRIRLLEMEKCRDRAIRIRNHWSRQYLHLWHHFWKQALAAIDELESSRPEQPEVICYHDWAFHNVIINGEKASLIDFDYMLVDQPVHDRANLIGRYLRLHRWSKEALFKILWNFDRFYPWRTGELLKLRIYLTFPYEYWILGRQYFLEQQPWPEKYYQEQWDRKIAGLEQKAEILEIIKYFE